jgi:hypothetical protein
MHVCPVCGFNELEDPPESFTICPSCGTEFDYDDAFASYAELRARWIQGGPRWWSQLEAAPANWEPYIQLSTIIKQPPPALNSKSLSVATFFATGPQGGIGVASEQQSQIRPPVSESIKNAPRQGASPFGLANLGRGFELLGQAA